MKNIVFYISLLISVSCNSQEREFKTIVDLKATDVINQGNTGTCWSYSASSFLESEIIRLTGLQIDISEMYNVRHTYSKKAWNYVMRQGKLQFGEGGLAHDVINSVANNGIVPYSVYTGLSKGGAKHNHSKLEADLKKLLNAYIEKPKMYEANWKADVEAVLDNRLGKNVTSFIYNNVNYTPQSFLEMTKINPNDYITITSFTHQPFYTNFILNIPDNFSNGSFYNVKLDDMMVIINHALSNGFTIELDCDISEKTFSSKHGIAVIPEDTTNQEIALTVIKKEKEITPEYRQQEFENYNTTDDHLMHITGIAEDQNGNRYYKVKNSWGKNSSRVNYGGYIYMSETYIKLKTISIMIHKDALPTAILAKFQ